jgi:hypothetical protein
MVAGGCRLICVCICGAGCKYLGGCDGECRCAMKFAGVFDAGCSFL